MRSWWLPQTGLRRISPGTSDKIDDENGIIAEHSRVLEASKQQKPVEIVARPIRYHTKPGELIFRSCRQPLSTSS